MKKVSPQEKASRALPADPTLDRRITNSFQIFAASLTVFFVGSILLTVPIYDRVIIPICRRLLRNPHGLTPLQRITVGLVLPVLAMVAAALTEIRRLQSPALPVIQVAPTSGEGPYVDIIRERG